jgi:hypothetical protein
MDIWRVMESIEPAHFHSHPPVQAAMRGSCPSGKTHARHIKLLLLTYTSFSTQPKNTNPPKHYSMDQCASPPGQQPFRFLDLPKELRLMIYERLIVRPSHDLNIYNWLEGDVTMRIVNPSLAAPMPLVCKMMYAEAAPIITKSRSTLRIILDFVTMDTNTDIGLRVVMRALADILSAAFLSAARGGGSFREYEQKARDESGNLLRLLVMMGKKSVRDYVDALRMIWYRVRTESCDVMEVALRGQHGLLLDKSVDYSLQGVDMEGLSGGFNIVVYEAPQMLAGADGAVAVHDKVIDEKTWNEKWV